MLEYDPVSFSLLFTGPVFTGEVNGLAAHAGSLFSLTGLSSSASLVRFNPDTLSVISGVPLGTNNTYDLTFDETGRLYALAGDRVLEFDPTTGVILNSSSSFAEEVNGLVAHSSIAVPEPTALAFLVVTALTLLGRRKRR